MERPLDLSVVCEETVSGYRHVYVAFATMEQILVPANAQVRTEVDLGDLTRIRDAVQRAIAFLREHEATA